MKLIRNIILAVVIGLVLLVVFRGPILKAAVGTVAARVTGLGVKVDKIDVGIFRPVLEIGVLKVYNPAGFPEELMLDLPQLYVRYDLPQVFQGKIHLNELRLNLEQLSVVKNKEGQTNVGQLAALGKKEEKPAGKPGEPSQKPGKAPSLSIDLLRLDIGRVVYKDFTSDPPSTREFNVNVHKEFRNITDPAQLVQVIVFEALARTNLKGLAGVDMSALSGSVQSIVDSVDPSAAGKVGETLKSLLPFGGKK
jgi:hypothetical protein